MSQYIKVSVFTLLTRGNLIGLPNFLKTPRGFSMQGFNFFVLKSIETWIHSLGSYLLTIYLAIGANFQEKPF